jgi:hypothetical protein
MWHRGFAVALVIATGACSSRSSTGSGSGTASSVASAMPADAADSTDLTVDMAVAMFEAVQICRVEPKGLDHECPAAVAFNAMENGVEDPGLLRYHIIQEAALKVLAHKSPAVRVQAVNSLSASFNEKELTQALIAERDPMAARAMIWFDGVSYEFYPDLFEALVARIDDPTPEVRMAAIERTAEVYNTSHPTLFTRIAAHIASDPDPAVRAAACLDIGALHDPRSVAIHDRLLVASTPPKLFDSCAVGLVITWLNDADKEHPVEAAYRRTLALLRKGPIRPGAPSVDFIEAVSGLERGNRMFDNLASWVDLADARDAIATFVASPRADEAARRAAAELVVNLEPTIPELRRYRARIRDRGALGDELREYFTNAESWVGQPPP